VAVQSGALEEKAVHRYEPLREGRRIVWKVCCLFILGGFVVADTIASCKCPAYQEHRQPAEDDGPRVRGYVVDIVPGGHLSLSLVGVRRIAARAEITMERCHVHDVRRKSCIIHVGLRRVRSDIRDR
jgi:hypothetical protein